MCHHIVSPLFSSYNPTMVTRWGQMCHVTLTSPSRVGGCGWDLAVSRPAAGGGAKQAGAGSCSHWVAREAPDLPDQPPLAQGANQHAWRAGPLENGDWRGATARWTRTQPSVTIMGCHAEDMTSAPTQVNWTINLFYNKMYIFLKTSFKQWGPVLFSLHLFSLPTLKLWWNQDKQLLHQILLPWTVTKQMHPIINLGLTMPSTKPRLSLLAGCFFFSSFSLSSLL